jgi:hypothetical protein
VCDVVRGESILVDFFDQSLRGKETQYSSYGKFSKHF